MNIAINEFVRRQTAESKYSHYDGSFDELVALVEKHFDQATTGYKDGVVLVPVPPEDFLSGVVKITGSTPLHTTFESRRDGEEPYLQIVALFGGEKMRAKVVEVVVYRHDILEEDGDASSEAEWEVVSINARPTEEEEPPTPMAMARNFLNLNGGTKAEYTAEEFARSIAYWSSHAMCGDQ